MIVIFMNDLPDTVLDTGIRELVELYHPAVEIDEVRKRQQGADWKVDLGQADREIANFVTGQLNRRYWRGSFISAYCPLFQ